MENHGMKAEELIGTSFLIGAGYDAVFTDVRVIDHRFLLVVITIALLNDWSISALFDLINEPMDTDDLTDDDTAYIKDRLTTTFNTSK